jgi:hypothetical protein
MIHFQGQLVCDNCNVGFLGLDIKLGDRLPQQTDLPPVFRAAKAAGWTVDDWKHLCPKCAFRTGPETKRALYPERWDAASQSYDDMDARQRDGRR